MLQRICFLFFLLFVGGILMRTGIWMGDLFIFVCVCVCDYPTNFRAYEVWEELQAEVDKLPAARH